MVGNTGELETNGFSVCVGIDRPRSSQGALPVGATVVPIILASDKTKLSQFRGDQVAWPVYMSIGNIAKETRRQVSARATILLGYIPVSKLECFSDETRQVAGYRLFHHCMKQILEPLIAAGRDGTEVVCADGCLRRVHPILAAYVADHPEQCLVTNVKENHCPSGDVSPDARGEPGKCLLRRMDETLELLNQHRRGEDPPEFGKLGLRAVYEPFWKHLPHANIYTCITPDILHQLHKGVFKDHLLKWCSAIIGEEELDRRFKAMADVPGLRHFKKGISHVTQWTGTEHKEMQKIFVALLAGAVDTEVLEVAQAVVDFIYFAQFRHHTTSSLDALERALRTFHEHKGVFIRLGVREHFNIPKIHSMFHYVESIRRKGAADGFNTELSERLHIDFAKHGYRAGNHRDYIAGMTTWLRRQDAVELRSTYLDWLDMLKLQGQVLGPGPDDDEAEDIEVEAEDQRFSLSTSPRLYRIAKRCTSARTTLRGLQDEHGASEFLPVFRSFVNSHIPNSPVLPSEMTTYKTYKQLRVERPWSPYIGGPSQLDRVRASPPVAARGRLAPIPGHFDTVILIENPALYAVRREGSMDGTLDATIG